MIIIDSLLSDASVLNKHSILFAVQKMLFSQISDKCLYVKKSSENLLKMIRAKCVWIITFSFNDNRKFSMNKNVCLNVPEAAKIDECWLNSLTNTIKISTPLSASVSEGDEPNCLLYWFVPTHNEVHSIRLLRKVNDHIITMLNFY